MSMDDITVRADLVFGSGEHTLSELQSLYREALAQLAWSKRIVAEYGQENERLGWENAGLRSDVDKLRRHRDMLILRLAEKSGAPES